MLFGKIDYLNLLPLHIYLKSSNLPSYVKASIEHKKAAPAVLNRMLKNRKLDSAIISSIESKRQKYKNCDVGICANKRVLSVLVEKNTENASDSESATSNALAKVLNAKGRVIMGDKALYAYLKNKENFVDLCELWHKKSSLPFMFARFSSIKKHSSAKRHMKRFLRQNLNACQRQKIPNYILSEFSSSRKIDAKDIKYYLNFIYYKIGKKEKKALDLYTKLIRLKRVEK